MAYQKSLFDDGVSQGSQTTPVAVVRSARTLTHEQKQFNRLIAQIAAACAELDLWRALAPIRNREHMLVVAASVEAMPKEEVAYWLGMAMHRKYPSRVLMALRFLLIESSVRSQV